mgnify:FL=1
MSGTITEYTATLHATLSYDLTTEECIRRYGTADPETVADAVVSDARASIDAIPELSANVDDYEVQTTADGVRMTVEACATVGFTERIEDTDEESLWYGATCGTSFDFFTVESVEMDDIDSEEVYYD